MSLVWQVLFRVLGYQHDHTTFLFWQFCIHMKSTVIAYLLTCLLIYLVLVQQSEIPTSWAAGSYKTLWWMEITIPKEQFRINLCIIRPGLWSSMYSKAMIIDGFIEIDGRLNDNKINFTYKAHHTVTKKLTHVGHSRFWRTFDLVNLS